MCLVHERPHAPTSHRGTSLVLIGTLAGFNLYLQHFCSSLRLCGALGGFIILMLWIYLANFIVLVDWVTNYELERPASRAGAA